MLNFWRFASRVGSTVQGAPLTLPTSRPHPVSIQLDSLRLPTIRLPRLSNSRHCQMILLMDRIAKLPKSSNKIGTFLTNWIKSVSKETLEWAQREIILLMWCRDGNSIHRRSWLTIKLGMIQRIAVGPRHTRNWFKRWNSKTLLGRKQ